MKAKTLALFILAAGLVTGGFLVAQAQTESKPASSDVRIDKLLEQNEKILKNQEEMLKELADLKEGVLQMRRRTS